MFVYHHVLLVLVKVSVTLHTKAPSLREQSTRLIVILLPKGECSHRVYGRDGALRVYVDGYGTGLEEERSKQIGMVLTSLFSVYGLPWASLSDVVGCTHTSNPSSN